MGRCLTPLQGNTVSELSPPPRQGGHYFEKIILPKNQSVSFILTGIKNTSGLMPDLSNLSKLQVSH